MPVKGLSFTIPEFYYDVSARIAPGAVLCGVLAWEYREALGPLFQLGAAAGSLVGLVAAYVAGMVLDTLAGAVFDLTRYLWAARLFARLFPQHAERWRADPIQILDDLADLHHKERLIKMFAERKFFEALLLGWVSLWFLTPGLVGGICWPWRAAIAAVLLVFCLFRHYWLLDRAYAFQQAARAGAGGGGAAL